MSFAVRLLPIDSVVDHPNADRLSICKVRGYDCIAAKLEDGTHRFQAGDRVIYIPEGAVLTEAQLKEHGFWAFNEQRGREMGTLSGREGNRVKPIQLRKIMSTGLIWPEPDEFRDLPDNTDVADLLGITKFTPEVPEALLRVAQPLFEAKTGYEISRLRMYPDFLVDDEVVVTEKLEGECLIMTYLGGARHEGLFADGRIAIATKGLSEKGLVFVDNDEARKVPVVRAAIASQLIEKFLVICDAHPTSKIQLFAEAVGPGVKKLHYAGKSPFGRAFDIKLDDRFLNEAAKAAMFDQAEIERVPVLYRGPYNRALIEGLREGQTTIGSQHIREGVVVTAAGDQTKRATELGDELRPILKLHSDVFLRKFNIADDDA